MNNYTLEQLDQLNTLKFLAYLDMDPISRADNDVMMKYEEKLAAEKYLFVCMRRIDNLLNILLKDDKLPIELDRAFKCNNDY